MNEAERHSALQGCRLLHMCMHKVSHCFKKEIYTEGYKGTSSSLPVYTVCIFFFFKEMYAPNFSNKRSLTNEYHNPQPTGDVQPIRYIGLYFTSPPHEIRQG